MQAYLTALTQLCQPVRQADYPATLEPMRALLAHLNHPQQRLRAVVVTGSTGKGTTCCRTARRLRAVGLRVGLYTSPHLHSFRERFVINERTITPDEFTAGATVVLAAAAQVGRRYSTFELATALAFWWFAQQQPDFVVLEIGVGGRWDAVNTVPNVLAGLTPIEAEHIALLGGSLERVAWHKAGIIQPGGQAITVSQTPPVMAVLRAEADALGAQLHQAADDMLPDALVANLAARGLIPDPAPASDTDEAPLPGRLEHLTVGTRQILIDGGHTPRAARFLRAAIERLAPGDTPVRIIAGLLGDKDAGAYFAALDSSRFHIVLTRAPGHRAAAPDTLLANAALRQAQVSLVDDLNDALTQIHTADESLVVVAGSLRLAAAAREWLGLLTADELEEARLTRALFDGPDYLAKLPANTPHAG
jgi:dihydrofolate synthase/folylpolyglutamate synthase